MRMDCELGLCVLLQAVWLLLVFETNRDGLFLTEAIENVFKNLLDLGYDFIRLNSR